MSLDNPKSGLGYASEFQSSALPWVTSSIAPATGFPVRFSFPKVTRFFTVSNHDGATNTLSFAFTRNGLVTGSAGIGQQKFTLNAGQTVTCELRIKELWLQGEAGTPSYSLLVGLTNIDASQMPVLSGTQPNGSTGWLNIG